MQEGANPLLEPIVPQRALPRTHGDHSGPRAHPRGLFHGAFPFFPFLSLFSYLPITCGNGKFIRGVFGRTGAFEETSGGDIGVTSPLALKPTFFNSGAPLRAKRRAEAGPCQGNLAGTSEPRQHRRFGRSREVAIRAGGVP